MPPSQNDCGFSVCCSLWSSSSISEIDGNKGLERAVVMAQSFLSFSCEAVLQTGGLQSSLVLRKGNQAKFMVSVFCSEPQHDKGKTQGTESKTQGHEQGWGISAGGGLPAGCRREALTAGCVRALALVPLQGSISQEVPRSQAKDREPLAFGEVFSNLLSLVSDLTKFRAGREKVSCVV